jgi:hypothetical protein
LSPTSSYQYNAVGRIVVLSASTLTELWSTPELGVGYTIAIGNVDADAALEIVTSGGFVYDGATHANQWAHSEPFGDAADTGDMDGDGIEEIIGMPGIGNVRAFNAVSRSVLWQSSTYFDLDTIVVADTNGDGRPEAIIGDGQWGNVTALSYDSTTLQLQPLWQINSQEHGVTSIAVGDLDADGASEIAWGTGWSSSGEDDFVVAGFTPSISVKWQLSNLPTVAGPFRGGALARIGGGASRLMFGTPLRPVALNPASGRIEIGSPATGSLGANSIDVADYDNDNIDELLLGTSASYDGFFVAYDFAADSIEWQSPQSDFDTAVDVTHADMNGDNRSDLIGITGQGFVDIYDIHAQTLLWRGPRSAGGTAVEVADLDNDGDQEVIAALGDRVVRYDRGALGSYSQQASAQLSGTRDLLIADLDGNNAKEIYILAGELWNYTSTLYVYDANLQLVRSVWLYTAATAMAIEHSAFGRKNLLIATSSSYTNETGVEIWAVDPVSGADVWRSPKLLGRVQRRSMQYVDIDGDGDREITFGTTVSMYHTR